MMRVGLYRPVHVKTLRSQKLRMLLTHRKLLQSKAIAIDNDLRGTLRNFGLKVGMVGTVRFEARIRELVENLPDLAALVEPLLIVRRTLREQFCILHRRLLAIVRDDEVCRRLMSAPGVAERWSRKSAQADKWNFCLTAGTLCPARSGETMPSRPAGTTHRPSRRGLRLPRSRAIDRGEFAEQFDVHPNQITTWKAQLEVELPMFSAAMERRSLPAT